MLHRIAILLAVLLGALFVVEPCRAALVTYTFKGVITKVASTTPGGIALSGVSPAVAIHQGTSTFTGLLQFEDSAPSFTSAGPPLQQLDNGLTAVFPVLRIPEPGVRRSIGFVPTAAQLGIVVDDSLRAGFNLPAMSIDPGFSGVSASARIIDRNPLEESSTPRYDAFSVQVGGPQFLSTGGPEGAGASGYVQLELGGDTSLFDNDPFAALADVEDYISLLYARSLLASTLYTAPDGEVFQLSLGGSITSFERVFPQDPIIFSLQAVPEPASWTLFALGLVAIFAVRRRKIG